MPDMVELLNEEIDNEMRFLSENKLLRKLKMQ